MGSLVPIGTLALLLAACQFSPRDTSDGAVNGSSDGSSSTIDAEVPPPDAACKSVCQDANTLLDCATNTPVSCPLGCHTDPTVGDRCSYPTPSNGATLDDLGTGDLVISVDATMDTSTGAIVTDGGTVIRAAGTGLSADGFRYDELGGDRGVLGVRSLAIANTATLRVAGARVLIVLAATDITIEGTLDASGGQVACTKGNIQQCGGAGGGDGGDLAANGTGCSPGGGGANGGGDSTGGGGGGYGSPAGGNGGTGNNPGGTGGAGNCSTQVLVPIAGGSGGGGGGGANAGVGGGGGGAVQLTALGHLRVHTTGTATASVRANGAGGRKGASGAGGGGGGSAGGILLEGQTVVIDNAILAANSGSGGAGNNGTDGNAGRLDTTPAAGGTGGKPGGQGAAKNGAPTAGTGPGDGTGGGGGGIGRIFINSGANQYMFVNGAVVSPVEYNATATPL